MSALIGLAIGLLVIFFIIALLQTILSSISEILSSISKETADWLGRKHVGCELYIPSILEAKNPWNEKDDSDQEKLKRYNPSFASILPPRPFTFISKMSAISTPHPSQEFMEINAIREILKISPNPPYQFLFENLEKNIKYPVKPPVKSSIESVPSWSPSEIDIGEPTLKLPYYKAPFSFLNSFVDTAYKDEKNRLNNAAQRKIYLIKVLSDRNLYLQALSDNAWEKRETAIAKQNAIFESALTVYHEHSAAFTSASQKEAEALFDLKNRCFTKGGAGLIERIKLAMQTIALPAYITNEFQSTYNSESGIIIHEHKFRDPASIKWVKLASSKPASKKEVKESIAIFCPAICLRLAAEIIRLDIENIVTGVAINGWADYIDHATGKNYRAFCASFFATKQQLENLDLSALDPVVAFRALKGVSGNTNSGSLIPITPIMQLNTSDPRFIDTKNILGNIQEGENLALIDWDDFEHLCGELFERAFAESGAQVKVTQASRDQGVDAVIFDPDPLRGGKIIVQAKRYKNTVDVSAVRDLYGAVLNEGAIKGILVTTSHFGPDAYAFSRDKPLTLFNGRELLGLLDKHGYKFRIDLAEAKRLTQDKA